MRSGACAPDEAADPEHRPDPNWWFSDDPADQARARAICWTCPVRAPCLEFGRRQTDGMWGGHTADQLATAHRDLPEDRFCTHCRQRLPPGWPTARHDDCAAEAEAEQRRAARAQVSAARACARCGAHLSPQARSCLVCRQIVGQPLPNRPWPGQ